MGILKYKDRRGKERYVVSKYWPQGSGRLRMYAPNHTAAKRLLTRVEMAILDGTWRQHPSSSIDEDHEKFVKNLKLKTTEVISAFGYQVVQEDDGTAWVLSPDEVRKGTSS